MGRWRKEKWEEILIYIFHSREWIDLKLNHVFDTNIMTPIPFIVFFFFQASLRKQYSCIVNIYMGFRIPLGFLQYLLLLYISKIH